MKQKPAFLKTFSEFTIAELRDMPWQDVFTLFFREVSRTFRQGAGQNQRKRGKLGKKNDREAIGIPLSVPAIHLHFRLPAFSVPHIRLNTTGFSEAMKRVFTIGPVQPEPVLPKKVRKARKQKTKKSETVVFSKTPAEAPKAEFEKPNFTPQEETPSVLKTDDSTPQREVDHPQVSQIH